MLANQNGRDEIGNPMPRRVRCFRIVGRGFSGGDFAPSADSIRHGLHQKYAAVLHNTETCFKRRLQPHVDLAECYGFNLHKSPERNFLALRQIQIPPPPVPPPSPLPIPSQHPPHFSPPPLASSR